MTRLISLAQSYLFSDRIAPNCFVGGFACVGLAREKPRAIALRVRLGAIALLGGVPLAAMFPSTARTKRSCPPISKHQP
ncbi:MAG: hypothetical protein ACAF41_05435 [Leptolyngbya sp. BL-A-14]